MQLQQGALDNPKLRGVLRITKQQQKGAAHSPALAISTEHRLNRVEEKLLTIPPLGVYRAAGWTNSWYKHQVLPRKETSLAFREPDMVIGQRGSKGHHAPISAVLSFQPH